MQKPALLITVVLLALLVGIGIGSRLDFGDAAPGSESRGPADREVLYWVAPMDPNFRRDEPGQSPMGMDLVPVYADEVDARPGVVSIDPVVVNNLGVRTARAERGPLPRLVDTTAHVSYDEDTVQHVHTRVDGWIETLNATAEGDAVAAGDLLFELYSPTLVNAQQEYLAALRSGSASLKSASRDRLLSLGMTAAEVRRLDEERRARQRVQVFATGDGVIAELGVREGMFVTPNTDVISIARLDTVWVFADVLERQAGWVSPGQEARIRFEALPGRVYAGKVDYLHPELDPATRTLRVRIRLANEDGRLRPNMFGRVRIEGRETGPVIHVPREAVIRSGHGSRVVIDLGGGRFESRQVSLGIESGQRIVVRDGVGNGERVVVSGQFLIDSESNVGTAFARMEDAAAGQQMDQDMHSMQDHPEDQAGMDPDSMEQDSETIETDDEQ